MAERPDLPDERDVPEARVESGRWRWAFLIWIVPVTAVLIGAWLGMRTLVNRGPSIEITFKTASGLEAGKTRVRYKDVEIGTVSSITFSKDRKDVLVRAALTREARTFLVEDTRFWVVRPRITGGQAFGLGTLLTGAFIALDPGSSPHGRRSFVGLETPPVVTAGAPGRQFILRAEDLGSLDIGSPVYFRRLRVGQVVTAEVDPDGKAVSFRVFVDAPYDQYVTTGTRFWNASGVDMSLGPAGFRFEAESLTSILIGGVAFQAPRDVDPGQPAAEGQAFTLYKNRETAFRPPNNVKDVYVMYFNQSVRGLSVGSAVDFRGVLIGEVARITLDNTQGIDRLRTAVEINIYPERVQAQLRQPGNGARPSALRPQSLQRLVERGLRGQLRTANFITGQLYVTLDFFPREKAVKLNLARTPVEIPTVPGGLSELQASLEKLVKQLGDVPFDMLVGDVRATMNGLQRSLNRFDQLAGHIERDVSPDVRATLEQVRATLARVQEVAPELNSTLEQMRATLERAQAVLSDDVPLQGDLRTTLRDLTRAAEAVRGLADYLERHPESLLRGKPGESTR